MADARVLLPNGRWQSSTERLLLDAAHLTQRPDASAWRAAWRHQERLYGRWEREFQAALTALDYLLQTNLQVIVEDALKEVHKSREHRLSLGDVIQRLVRGFRQAIRGATRGWLAMYLGLAADAMEDAGQFTLDALGLNRTFRWASQRDFVRDELAVRGSKIIQHLYGNHVRRLAQIVVEATDPAHPQTVDDVVGTIMEQWERVAQSDARRIARTELATVWERTNWYTLRANGVRQVKWLTAQGPAIGVTVAAPCQHCLDLAAGSPYAMDTMTEIPPAHPNCRCTLVPVLDARWLPPAEPWTGSENPPPLRTLGNLDRATQVDPNEGPVQKAGYIWGGLDAPGWSGRGWNAH